jgi:hypothetical protein
MPAELTYGGHCFTDIPLRCCAAIRSPHSRLPPKSPFDMNPSTEERQALESMARKYTSPYCYVIRAKVILPPLTTCPTMSSPHD